LKSCNDMNLCVLRIVYVLLTGAMVNVCSYKLMFYMMLIISIVVFCCCCCGLKNIYLQLFYPYLSVYSAVAADDGV